MKSDPQKWNGQVERQNTKKSGTIFWNGRWNGGPKNEVKILKMKEKRWNDLWNDLRNAPPPKGGVPFP